MESQNIYYIYFSYSKNLFLANNGIDIIKDFRIKEADITYPKENLIFMKAISNIHLCRYIFNLSKIKYLQKKNLKNLSIFMKKLQNNILMNV